MNRQKPTIARPFSAPDSVSWPVVTPLFPSVVYASETPDMLDAQYDGDQTGYTYAREGHPNADVVAAHIDALEGATDGVITGSGMAAIGAVLLGLCRAGDHVIGAAQLYGQSLRMMQEDLPRFGVTSSLVDPGDPAAVEAALTPKTRLILVEVVANPTLRVTDLAALAALAKARGVLLVVDNTFTTPRAIQPLAHGADIVVNSVTKILAGHADVTLGHVAARDPEIHAALRNFAITAGLTPSPFDCWLAERGLLSFSLRYDRAQDSAARLADHLADLPGVTRVLYPGRADHPDYDRAQSLLKGQNGTMVSFEIDGGREAANALVKAAQGIAFAPTLGDVGTTLTHPVSSSHRRLSDEAREKLGLSEGFFRVSVGLEEPDDLAAVFTKAVAASQARGT